MDRLLVLAWIVVIIVVCGPIGFIYGWARDIAFGHGAQLQDASKIGVMAVVCYEMLLVASAVAFRLLFPRRQIVSGPRALANVILIWVTKAWAYVAAALFCLMGTFLLLGSAACLVGTFIGGTAISDAINLFVVGTLSVLIAAVGFHAARAAPLAPVRNRANEKQPSTACD